MASYPNGDLLISSDWLAANLSNPNVKVVDTRGAPRYAEGHIPGAVNIPVARLDDPTRMSQPLPPERMSVLLSNAGLTNDDTIVIYDDGAALMAGRLFWVLEYYGHKKLGVLDGGLTRWAAEQRDLTREATNVVAGSYTATPVPARLATKDDVKAALGQPNTALLDVRSQPEYTGEMQQAAKAGHIPGAQNVDWQTTMMGMNVPTVKSADELTGMYSSVGVTPDKRVITYCQGGVRAAHSYFVLRLLGFNDVANYTGSWGDWGNDPSTPVEK